MELEDFLNPKTFSQNKRPSIGDYVFFVPPANRTFLSNRLKRGAVAQVLSNTPHFVSIRFNGESDSDLVSPNFLAKERSLKGVM